MGAGDVYPTEMPNHPSSPIPALDGDTAERLLSGRLDPDDAPPAYAEVARLLQAAAAPASSEELAGQEAALALFRVAWEGPAEVGDRRSGGVRGGSGGVRGRLVAERGRPGARRRSGRARGRVVAVALAGVLVVGGAVAGGAATGGLWTPGGASFSGGLRSPSGGPGAGAAGSGAPGSRVGPGVVSGSGGSGLLRPRGSAVVTERERAVARHGGGGGSRGGGAAHGAKPVPTPEAKAGKAKAGKPAKPAANKPKAQKPVGKGPKATPGQSANRAGGKPK
jgi:hypothetical protein